MPEESGFVPSISAGYGGTFIDLDILGLDDAYTNSWYVGLEWSDVFVEGNSLGAAIGMPTYLVSVDGDDVDEDAGWAYELFYKFQITDNITVTPAITYLSKPFQIVDDNDFLDAFSGLVKTTFTF